MGLQQLTHCRLAAPATTARPDRGTSKIETTGSATTSSSSCRVAAAILTLLACLSLALSY